MLISVEKFAKKLHTKDTRPKTFPQNNKSEKTRFFHHIFLDLYRYGTLKC
jgi:hypothetical protein